MLTKFYYFITITCLTAFTFGCSKKPKEAVSLLSDGANLRNVILQTPTPTNQMIEADKHVLNEMFSTIYFEFDRSDLNSQAVSSLEKIGRFLTQRGEVNVKIEGHCDTRGTSDYNIALGERRSWAIKNWLTEYGIYDQRINTISYGSEFPVNMNCHDEDCHGQNRRGKWDHFTIGQSEQPHTVSVK